MTLTAVNRVFVALLLLTAGCAGDSTSSSGGTAPSTSGGTGHSTSTSGGTVSTAPPPTVDIHAHPSHGPHDGELIELGNEEYHAELIHDDASVTIYILNGAATAVVPIEATEILVNLKHDGAPEQFTLTASPDTGDPTGRSSRFVSSDAELAGHLDEEAAEPQLVLTIDGVSYRGSLEHSHDHGHSHD